MPHDPGMPMTCRELFERLSDYVDGELPAEICDHIRRHMEDCDPCVAFANTLKKTADLCHRLPAHPLPLDLAESLQAMLSRCLQHPDAPHP
jgi:anti-sigma factor RsiW